MMPYIMSKPDFDSDAYNNCLLIQRCLEDLDSKGYLTELEKQVVNLYYAGHNTSGISKILNVSRSTVESNFKSVTKRVSFILGADFTDDAILSTILDN